MKKIKMMLLSLAIVSILGGVLAFKSKYSVDYCTRAIPMDGICRPTAGAIECPNFTENKTTVGGVGDFICTTTPGFFGGCSGRFCTGTSRQLTDNGG